MTSADLWSDRRSSSAACAALVAVYTEIAIAFVVFTAAIFSPDPGATPLTGLMTCMAILGALQLTIAFTLRHRDERLRRVGMLGAAALALIGLLITAPLVVAVGMLLAAFVIDSALGVRPADFDQILSEVGIAQYVSAEDMLIAIPIVGWLGLLNARLALGALSETGRKPSDVSS